jgi:uncharacterized membrane protein
VNRFQPNRVFVALLALCLFVLPQSLQACAACYGASDSPMAQGMNWGILTLLAVIGCVLGGIVSFFVYLGWRSSTPDSLTSVDSPNSDR